LSWNKDYVEGCFLFALVAHFTEIHQQDHLWIPMTPGSFLFSHSSKSEGSPIAHPGSTRSTFVALSLSVQLSISQDERIDSILINIKASPCLFRTCEVTFSKSFYLKEKRKKKRKEKKKEKKKKTNETWITFHFSMTM